MSLADGKFVVATPTRTVCDDNARALEKVGRLRFLALGTRKGTHGVPPEHTLLKPAIGLAAYVAARALSTYWGEWCRFGLLPWFDRWVQKQLIPGDHILSSYGYTTSCFRWVRAHGGTTFLDAGNSHIENYWEIISEEHRRWNCPLPPFAPHWLRRSREMLEHTDVVLSPSSWVTESFLKRGFRPEQILRNVYPLDLRCFTPPTEPRPKEQPLTVISTGQLSLRKGTPYLLEAFRMVLRREPAARLLLTTAIADSIKPILHRYSDLPIDWSPSLPHPQLAERLRSADVFVLPSLEEGMARTATEALACGLPVVVTHNSGAADLVKPGISGTIVPVRDPTAIASAILEWGETLRTRTEPPSRSIDPALLSYERFQTEFLEQLRALGMQ
ncbi:MAG: glycosyltransferase [Verrucomicrobiaceae bacterium]|nr:MAG: glycosyltransferase [Verrucomicrobiaceae bacterium]